MLFDGCDWRSHKGTALEGFGHGCRDLRVALDPRQPGRGDSFGDGRSTDDRVARDQTHMKEVVREEDDGIERRLMLPSF